MSVEIRFIEKDDFDQWHKLWTEYLVFYKTSMPEEVYATTFERFLDPKSDVKAVVAELDGKLVGLAHYVFQRNTWNVQDICYLNDLFVSPTARRKKIGQSLIQKVYDIADENHAPHVYWTTQEFNATARKLYDQIGEKTPFIKYQRRK